MDQVDFPYFKRFTEKKFSPAKKEKKFIDDVRKKNSRAKQKVEDGVWLTFLPVMDLDEFGDLVVEELKLHLVNHTSLNYKFTYKLHFFGKPDFELTNTVHPFEISTCMIFLLKTWMTALHLILNSPYWTGRRLSFWSSRKAEAYKQFFARIIERSETKEPGYLLPIAVWKYPDKTEEDKVGLGPPLAAKAINCMMLQSKTTPEPARTVIDLHIDKLTDDWKSMSNYEILSLQLKTFEKYYHLALVHHQPTLIVILEWKGTEEWNTWYTPAEERSEVVCKPVSPEVWLRGNGNILPVLFCLCPLQARLSFPHQRRRKVRTAQSNAPRDKQGSRLAGKRQCHRK